MHEEVENLIETLQDRIDATSFLAILMQTNFAEIFSGVEAYTILVPDDMAFKNLPYGILEKWSADPDKLNEIVAGHVITGRLKAFELLEMDEVMTMANTALAIERHNEGTIIGGAKIVEPDIIATNGVIHIVDIVLM